MDVLDIGNLLLYLNERFYLKRMNKDTIED